MTFAYFSSLLNNYLIFNFVTTYMPYLNSENTRVLDLYHKEFTGRVPIIHYKL